MLPINPNDKEYPSKCEEYMNYISNHKERVKTAYCKFFKDKLPEIFDDQNQDYDFLQNMDKVIENNIEKHDESKYTDAEFYGYRAHFYPTATEKEQMLEDEEYAELVQEEYAEAWIHHQQNNPHHPQYYLWYNEDGTLVNERSNLPLYNMNMPNIIEMLCDWAAMSKGENDYNYLSWICSPSSIDEREILPDVVKKSVQLISSKIYSNYDEYKERLEEALFGKEE